MATYDDALASGYILRLTVTQGTQNISTNTTTVNWSLVIIKGTGSGKWADGPHSYGVAINGSGYSGSISSYNFNNYSTLTLRTGSTSVAHNADGTKSISVSATFNDNNTWGELGDGATSGSLGLTTIPRATTPTFTNPMTANTAYTITLPRASSSFTHTVQYKFGSVPFTTIATGATTSTSWTPPLSLLNEIPNNVSGTGTIRVITYNGATNIGTKDVTFTLTTPTSVVPTFTTVTHSEGTAGVAANVGAYVQNISKLVLAITGATGIYGSTIASYKIEVAGQVLNVQSGTTSAPISSSGTVPIVATITDTRGRTATTTVNATVLAYAPPSIVAITGQRALITGVPDDDGTYIRVNINAAVQSLMNTTQRNALVYKIYTRLRGDTPWTLKDTTTPGGITFNSYEAVGTYPIEDTFEVLVEIIDDFSTSAIQFTVASSAIFMHWDGADGVGIGKYREQGMLDIKGQAYQNDGKKILDAYCTPLSTTDLDTITAAGTYEQDTGANGTLARHYPIDTTAGILEVMTGSAHTTQNFYCRADVVNKGRVFSRGKYAGAWRAWRELTDLGTARPAFQAHGASTAARSGTSVNLRIPFVTEDFDQGSHYDTTNSRFVAPVAGLYQFNYSIVITTEVGGPEIRLMVNGSPAYSGTSGQAIGYGGGYQTFGNSSMVILSAGDYVEVWGQNNNTSSYTMDLTRSMFSGLLIDSQ